jgi:hypothetical protein
MFDAAVMGRGDGMKADQRALQLSGNAPAAVFCQEVGVVQLAGSVKELQQSATDGTGGACGQSSSSGVMPGLKVLKKPRMFVAAA